MADAHARTCVRVYATKEGTGRHADTFTFNTFHIYILYAIYLFTTEPTTSLQGTGVLSSRGQPQTGRPAAATMQTRGMDAGCERNGAFTVFGSHSVPIRWKGETGERGEVGRDKKLKRCSLRSKEHFGKPRRRERSCCMAVDGSVPAP